MELSIKNNTVILLYDKGYIITAEGLLKNPKGKIIKGNLQKSKSGDYKSFNTRLGNSYVTISFHKLQAYQKFGNKIFEEGIQVRHLNGNSLDNSEDNIDIGTAFQNSMDKSPESRLNASIKAARHKQDSTRSYEERCLIYEDLKNGLSYKEIILKHGITSKGTLSYMKNKSIEYKEYKKTKVK